MLKLNSISKRFPVAKKLHIDVLSEISLEIPPGKIIGLIGLNGAGKTTLLRIIAELYKPTSGLITFDLDTQNVVRKTALLSSEHGLYRNLTTEQMIRYFGLLQNKNFQFDTNEVQDLIFSLGLKDILSKKVDILSSGMRQKLLILLAFINDPYIILLDEPATYLDFLGRKQLDDLLTIYKQKNRYIVYATHNLNDVTARCDHCILLDQGKVLFAEDLEQLFMHHNTRNLEQIVWKKINETTETDHQN